MQDSGGDHHVEKGKNRHISPTVGRITTKFGMVTQFDPLDRSDRKIFKNLKVQDGGGRHFEKSKYRHS